MALPTYANADIMLDFSATAMTASLVIVESALPSRCEKLLHFQSARG